MRVEDSYNFSQIRALVVDPDHYSSNLVGQILRGFGLDQHVTVHNGKEAMRLLLGGGFDLVICECVLPDMPAADLVRWLRRLPKPAIKYIPVVMLTGYAQMTNVTGARDCGVNSVVRKPVAPSVLFDHIVWSAKTDRPFIEASGYTGPCRRFKFEEQPPGVGRRESDHATGTDNPETDQSRTEKAQAQ